MGVGARTIRTLNFIDIFYFINKVYVVLAESGENSNIELINKYVFELSSPPKRPTLAQIREGGLDNGDFLFLKIFQNFLKFYNFYTKSATGGLFYYYFIVFK